MRVRRIRAGLSDILRRIGCTSGSSRRSSAVRRRYTNENRIDSAADSAAADCSGASGRLLRDDGYRDGGCGAAIGSRNGGHCRDGDRIGEFSGDGAPETGYDVGLTSCDRANSAGQRRGDAGQRLNSAPAEPPPIPPLPKVMCSET